MAFRTTMVQMWKRMNQVWKWTFFTQNLLFSTIFSSKNGQNRLVMLRIRNRWKKLTKIGRNQHFSRWKSTNSTEKFKFSRIELNQELPSNVPTALPTGTQAVSEDKDLTERLAALRNMWFPLLKSSVYSSCYDGFTQFISYSTHFFSTFVYKNVNETI